MSIVQASQLLVGTLFESVGAYCEDAGVDQTLVPEWTSLHSHHLENHPIHNQLLLEKACLLNVASSMTPRLHSQFRTRCPHEQTWRQTQIHGVIGMSRWKLIAYLESTMDDDMDWRYFLCGK